MAAQEAINANIFDAHLQKRLDDLKKHNKDEFKFENLVFNGGGAKCVGQIGTLEVLKDLNIYQNIKRFGGTSGGALTATFAALGYSPEEIKRLIFGQNHMKQLITGKTWTKWFTSMIQVPYNILFGGPGIHKGNIEQWVGDEIDGNERLKKIGITRNVTFEELYNETNQELAIVATDIIRKECVFFHVNTYPKLPIVKALRMSMGYPGYLTPVSLKGSHIDDTGVYIDGGFLSNFPIMCFDGWYLSTEETGSFYLRVAEQLHDLPHGFARLRDNRFRDTEDNLKKTIGVMVYTPYDDDTLKTVLEERVELPPKQMFPDTKLKREREPKLERFDKEKKKLSKLMAARQAWIQFWYSSPRVDDVLSKEEVDNFLRRAEEQEEVRLLFPDINTIEDLRKKMKVIGDNRITLGDFSKFTKKIFYDQFRDLRKNTCQTEFTTNFQYIECLFNTVINNVTRYQFEEHDVHRTIGIDTGYLETFDFDMHEDDQTFLIKQGKIGTVVFLEHYLNNDTTDYDMPDDMPDDDPVPDGQKLEQQILKKM